MSVDFREHDGGGPPLVLLHGFGASAADLYPLSTHSCIGRYRTVVPEAPKLIRFDGRIVGRAWFPRDDAGIERALFGGYFDNLREIDPPGLSESSAELLETIDALELDTDDAVFAGFSQGAMVALETALALATQGRRPKALILFSGALIAGGRWSRNMHLLSGLPVFQSHGRFDTVLAPKHGEDLGRELDRGGCRRRFFEFDGSHGIPEEVLSECCSFLSDVETGVV